jgi:gliding motility-associated-like protein
MGITGLWAQNSGDCRSSIPICADVPILAESNGRGDVDDFDPDVITSTGCLEKGSLADANIENNTSWFVFRAAAGGTIGFDIEALSDTAEWDFAVYGPDADCGTISSGEAQPIRCNYEFNTNSRFTGLGVNPETGIEGVPSLTQNKNPYDEWLDVQEGEIYYILINNYATNFDGNAEPFSLRFTGDADNGDPNGILDCTIREEFLGLDINACIGDPDIVLSALRTPFGPEVAHVTWSVDFDDDGTIDQVLADGPTEFELTVSSPNSGRYFVEVQSSNPVFPEPARDDILITFHGDPVILEPEILDDISDSNNVRIIVEGNSDYEYSLNGGPFRDEDTFYDIPPGINTVTVNDKNGCGTSEQEFLMVGYPKFFTPNGDPLHNTWHVLGIETLATAQISIFDRYGKLLKQLSQDSAGWDGTFNGKPMPASDYWFRFEYSREEEGVLVASTVKTHFTLKR